MKVSSISSNCNTVKTSAKTVTNPSKKHRSPRHPNALGSYLTITAGAAAVSLPNADAAIISYNGPAVTVTQGDASKWLYFSPLAAPSDPTLGTRAGTSNTHAADNFQIKYSGTNYLYTQKFEHLLKMYWGTASGGGGQVPLKLGEGATIDATSNTWFNNTWAYMNKPGWTTTESPWAIASGETSGYVPFQFSFLSAPTDYYYGWANYTYSKDSTSLTLNNFAYNNTPNEAILSGAGAVPEPSSMLLLAMGGSSVLVVRRRRKSQQTAELIAS